VAEIEGSTGHARIEVDARGENRIVLYAGANGRLDPQAVRTALARARPGDWLVLQNETNLVVETARLGKALGLKVAYSAAPFMPAAAAEVLVHVDLLAVNEVEAAQLEAHLGCDLADLKVPLRLVTAGARGASLRGDGLDLEVAAWEVDPVDTTGAGDVFIGYVVSALARGSEPATALREAAAAAALQVARRGAADAIPVRAEVLAFLDGRKGPG
jgi:ribokinase